MARSVFVRESKVKNRRVFHQHLGNLKHQLKLNKNVLKRRKGLSTPLLLKKQKEKNLKVTIPQRTSLKENNKQLLVKTQKPFTTAPCSIEHSSDEQPVCFSCSYYLKALSRSLFLKADNPESKRRISHFNLTRWCFDLINRLKKPINNTEGKRRAKKVLVLDLDETLIHTFRQPQSFKTEEIQFNLNGESRTLYIKKRPFVDNFLKKMADLYTIVIFTAGKKEYADPIINLLDPSNSLISKRLFSDSCLKAGKVMIKDLRILGTSLKDIVIVDNLALSFGLQVENGIPIVCFKGEEDDTELKSLESFLKQLYKKEDVRTQIMEYFKWNILKMFCTKGSSLLKYYF